MGTLHLVRHGQASFGAADYDCLSPMGEQQCRQLGVWFAERGVHFSATLRGTLQRHRQSFDAIAQSHPGLSAPLVWPGLDEYDAEGLVRAVATGPLASGDSKDIRRVHFKLLREALTRWMAGELHPARMPTWAEFRAGVLGALDHVRSQCDGDVLLVSSGGPISTAVAMVLDAPDDTVIELNLRMRNSALTEFAFTPKRHALVTFNTLPHLDHPERAGWVTHA